MIALAQGSERAVNLTVGFRPREVQFDAAGNHAYVITQDGVSVIDLGVRDRARAGDRPADSRSPIRACRRRPRGPHRRDRRVRGRAPGRHARRCASSTSARSRAGLRRPARLAGDRHRPRARRHAHLRGAARREEARDRRRPGRCVNPSGVRRSISTNATLGSLVLSADGTRAVCSSRTRRSTSASRSSSSTSPAIPHVTWPLKKSVRAVGISPTGDTALVLDAKAFGDPAQRDDVRRLHRQELRLHAARSRDRLRQAPDHAGRSGAVRLRARRQRRSTSRSTVATRATATRALQVVTTQTGVVTDRSRSARRRRRSASCPARTRRSSRSAIRSAACRSSTLVSDGVRTVTGFDLNSHIVN